MSRRRALMFALAGLPAAVLAARPAREPLPSLSVLSFNVLAPLWAAPRWYPESLDPALLDRAARRERIVALLRNAARTRDIVCLQEVEAQEFGFFEKALGAAFTGAFASHDAHYWSNWLVPELPWTPNGNAIFVRRAALGGIRFRDIALGGTGNHAIAVSGEIAANDRPLRAASLHLDSDSNTGRLAELRSLLAQWPQAPGVVDLVAGDINEDTVIGSAAGELKRAAFADVLAGVGNREATHPFGASYYASPRWAIIDHVLARGAAPLAGDVFDFGAWSIADEVARIAENFRQCGSDHFPVAAQVAI